MTKKTILPPAMKKIIDGADAGGLNDLDPDEWIKATGQTPVEFLVALYRNPRQRTQERLAAAKAILEYAHRKLPQRIEVEGKGTMQLNAEALARLSDAELAALQGILDKLET